MYSLPTDHCCAVTGIFIGRGAPLWLPTSSITLYPLTLTFCLCPVHPGSGLTPTFPYLLFVFVTSFASLILVIIHISCWDHVPFPQSRGPGIPGVFGPMPIPPEPRSWEPWKCHRTLPRDHVPGAKTWGDPTAEAAFTPEYPQGRCLGGPGSGTMSRSPRTVVLGSLEFFWAIARAPRITVLGALEVLSLCVIVCLYMCVLVVVFCPCPCSLNLNSCMLSVCMYCVSVCDSACPVFVCMFCLFVCVCVCMCL